MDKIIDKGIIFVLGTLMLSGSDHLLIPVITVLAAFSYLALSVYFTKIQVLCALMICFAAACFFQVELALFLPLLCYDCLYFAFRWGFGIMLFGCLPLIWLDPFHGAEPWKPVLWLLCFVIAGVLSVRSKEGERRKAELLHQRDDSTELKLSMQKRQQELLEKQDYEVYLATLQERNRIAREIHDNVGHMLSRSILQMGALLTIYKEEPLHGQLSAVNATLNEAMNNIRESIHDLHNESVDLQQAILAATQELKDRYQISLDYDMTPHIPRNVKYCFIAIVKEALVNVLRHSNADHIMLLLREHPGFYQISIEDNGTVGTGMGGMEVNAGIGISNMKDRVEALGGTIRFSAEQGFRILASVPKEKERIL